MKKIAILLAGVMLTTVFTGCGNDSGNEVMVESVSQICNMNSETISDRFAGVVSPQGETKIEKLEDSVIEEIFVEAGDMVEEGQSLFKYDTDQLSIDVEKAELELEQLKATVQTKTQEKTELEAERKSASSDAKLEYTIEIRDAEAAIMEANYNITLKQKEVDKLKESYNSAEVKSPVKGKVKSINPNGETDEETGAALPFMTIVETSGFLVKGYANEANIAVLSEGTEVIIRSRKNDSTWSGTVKSIDLENPVQNQNYGMDDDTQTSSKYPFYVSLEDTNGLMLGEHVYIEPDYGQLKIDSSKINLPSCYIVDIEDSPYVWAMNSRSKLEKRSITLGDYNEEMDTYVVESGLEPDDHIAFPDDTLTEGMKCMTFEEMQQKQEESGAEEGIPENGAEGIGPEGGETMQDMEGADGEVLDGTGEDIMAVPDKEGTVDGDASGMDGTDNSAEDMTTTDGADQDGSASGDGAQ